MAISIFIFVAKTKLFNYQVKIPDWLVRVVFSDDEILSEIDKMVILHFFFRHWEDTRLILTYFFVFLR